MSSSLFRMLCSDACSVRARSHNMLMAIGVLALAIFLQSFTIVIDAGHGGKDPGCLGKQGGKEKNINLAVAKAVGKLLEENEKDIKVIYTRTTDVFVELNERAAIANRAKADLFVSIHTNSLHCIWDSDTVAI